MIATLQFNLPEEQEEFRTAQDAHKLSAVLWGMDQWLRAKLKYEQLPQDVHCAYQSARDELHKMLSEHEVSL